MSRSFFVGAVFVLLGGGPLQAASSWVGNPLNYQPVTVDRADASLQDIRSRALSGHLTADDILKAAERIKNVQQAAPAQEEAPALLEPSDVQPVVSKAIQPFYHRAGTDLEIPISDVSAPLTVADREQMNRTLDGIPVRHLFLIHQIEMAPVVNDVDRGQLLVRTQGGRISLYGSKDLPEALIEGTAAIVYESIQGSPLGAEWAAHGDFTDFLQTYKSWIENTSLAFEEAARSNQAPEALSKLFFVASLFTDDSLSRITTYNPAPEDMTWQMNEGHYGFGPYAFDIYRNQIVHLTRGGVLLAASAAAIPSLWTRQGLGN